MMGMAKKKSGDEPQKDRHRPHRMVRLPVDVYEQLMKLAEQNDRAISRELRRIVIEELKRQSLWPPTGGQDTST